MKVQAESNLEAEVAVDMERLRKALEALVEHKAKVQLVEVSLLVIGMKAVAVLAELRPIDCR